MKNPPPRDEREALLLKQDARQRQLWGRLNAERARLELSRAAFQKYPEGVRSFEHHWFVNQQRLEMIESWIDETWAMLGREYPDRLWTLTPAPHRRKEKGIAG